MNYRFIFLAPLALASCAAFPDGDGYPTSDIDRERFTVLVGQRQLDEDDYSPVEDPPQLTFEYSDGGGQGRFGYEVGLAVSKDDTTITGVELDQQILEAYAGIRREFGQEAIRPFFGAGVAVSQYTLDASGPGGSGEVDDTTFGGYLHGGIVFDVGSGLAFVLDGRAVFADDYEIDGVEGDGNSVSLGVGVAFNL